MPADEPRDESCREQFEEGVEKAKEGAKKLAGWLGRKLESTVEQIKSSEVVREKTDRYSQYQVQRNQDRQFAAIASIYDQWAANVRQSLLDMDESLQSYEKSIDAIQYNVNALRLRGVDEQDAEMREYQTQIRDLRAEQHALDDAKKPFIAELERLDRQRRAALARLEADRTLLAQLQDEARGHVADSRQRLSEISGNLSHLRETPEPEKESDG